MLRLLPALACTILLASPLAAEEGRANLSHIYPDWAAWEKDCSQLEEAVETFSRLQKEALEGPTALLRALETWESVRSLANKVEGYVRLRLQLDATDAEAQAREQRLRRLTSRWDGEASSWFVPRVLALGQGRVDEWLGQELKLAVYRRYLHTLFRRVAHELTPREEELLALQDVFREQTGRLHRALTTVEAQRPAIELSDGATLEITPAASRTMLWELTDRDDRRRAQQAFLKALGTRSQTYAALLSGVVERVRFVARARRYPSALDYVLDLDAIPSSSVESLLRVARDKSPVLREVHRRRARHLGLASYGSADQFVPLKPLAQEVSYAEAKRLILDSAKPLGDEVQAVLREAFDNGWIDAFERPNKLASGSATYVYGAHPYVLVAYRGTVLDLFVLAHELGHAVHSHLAHRAQPYITSLYSTLTGEAVASLHELLLVEKLLQDAGSPSERIGVADFAIQNVLRTFYRPAIDADFELQLYGEESTVTAEGLDALYGKVLESYYGDSLKLEPWDRHGWQQVPHFFTAPLYMLRYGLAYAAASALAEELTSSDPGARQAAQQRYLDLLRAGGSDDPTVLLAKAGADLSAPATYEAVIRRLEEKLSLLSQSGRGGPGW